MNAKIPPPKTTPGLPSSAPPSQGISNRRQMLLFAILTLVLTVITVTAGRVWLRNSETLTFAVGDPLGPEARFASRLATVLKSTGSRLRLRIVYNPDSARALTDFDRRKADLAVLRTDARVPSRARSLAILEHDVVLLISANGKKIKSLAELKKRKIAVLGDGNSNAAFVRSMLDISDNTDAGARVQAAPSNSTLDKLLGSGGYNAIVVIAHTSTLVKGKRYEQYARSGGFTLNAIDEAKALARRNPGISEETLATGMLSSAPQIPDDDLDTIGLQWILVAQSGMSTTTAGDLARAIYEGKSGLALEDGFASKIEPADTDKDAFIVAHQGAAEYINDDTKSFMDRYSDVLYLAAAALSVIGSIFAGIYTKVTRIAPEQAGELATAILGIGDKVKRANSPEALDSLQDQLEQILRGAVIGLRDGTLSSDGLDAFKLGHQLVREEIAARRDYLARHPGGEEPAREGSSREDNVVIVKAAQSA